MRFILGLALACLLALVAVASSPARPQNNIHFFVVVPPGAVTTVTPEQAREAVEAWVGKPTDPACLGPDCTIEGYFRSQVGKVFDYDITVVNPGPWPISGPVDACGQGGIDRYWFSSPVPGYSLSGERTFSLVLGGGGWAGHNPGQTAKSGAFGMGGDWGVQTMWGVPLLCVPSGMGFMDRGFAHEFEGMMGAFRNGATYDYFCCERAYEDQHRRNVLQWSRGWLRNP